MSCVDSSICVSGHFTSFGLSCVGSAILVGSQPMAIDATSSPNVTFGLRCVDSALFLVRSPQVIARAPACIAFLATIVKANGLDVTIWEGRGQLKAYLSA